MFINTRIFIPIACVLILSLLIGVMAAVKSLPTAQTAVYTALGNSSINKKVSRHLSSETNIDDMSHGRLFDL